MEKISSIYNILSRYKYPIIIIIGFVLVGFVGENSFYNRMMLQFEIQDIEDEIAQYNKVYETGKKQLRDLERNPRNIERIARERYFMKTADEDIFVLSTDQQQPVAMPNAKEAEE